MNIENICKKHSLRLTKERRSIFEFIEKKHIFKSQDLLDNFENIGRASIFRNLKTFLKLGIIRKIDIWENAETYEFCDEKHHHEHIKCESCWKIESFEIANICKKIVREAQKKGFTVKSHSVNIMGICENCTS